MNAFEENISEEGQLIERNRIELSNKGFKISPGVPWRRYFARCFDAQIGVSTIAVLLLFIIYVITNDLILIDGLTWIIGLVSYVIYLFVEALLIKLTGTTFGKYTMGIRIITSSYDSNYTYTQLVKRGFLVLVKGLGLNVPIVSCVTMIIAMNHVSDDKEGQASWDFDCDTLVAYREFEPINYILIVLNAAISLGLIILGLYIN